MEEQHIPNKDALRQELGDAKQLFHDVLNSLSGENFAVKSQETVWTVKQLMTHLAMTPEHYAKGMENVKEGRGFNPPHFIANKISVWLTNKAAKNVTRESLAERYNKGHEYMLNIIENLTDEQWQKKAKVFGKVQSSEDFVHHVRQHLDEHIRDIHISLGR